jgi:hypothetical protein
MFLSGHFEAERHDQTPLTEHHAVDRRAAASRISTVPLHDRYGAAALIIC